MRTARLTHAGRCLFITQGKRIDLYVIDDARPDPKLADPALNLTKADGTVYCVHQDKHGWQCSCADANYRQRICKHIKALMAVGKIEKESS